MDSVTFQSQKIFENEDNGFQKSVSKLGYGGMEGK